MYYIMQTDELHLQNYSMLHLEFQIIADSTLDWDFALLLHLSHRIIPHGLMY